jgi:hypothetical protein
MQQADRDEIISSPYKEEHNQSFESTNKVYFNSSEAPIEGINCNPELQRKKVAGNRRNATMCSCTFCIQKGSDSVW